MTPSAHINAVFRIESIIYDCILESLIDPDSPYVDDDVQSTFSRICDVLGIDWVRLNTEATDEANAESLGSSDSDTESSEEGDTVVYVEDPDSFITSDSSSEEEEEEEEEEY